MTEHCQQASKRYEQLLEESGNDPRSAAGYVSLSDQRSGGGGGQPIDARDAVQVEPEYAT